MQLYLHQNKALSDIRTAYKQGYTAPVLVAGCGYGKTCVASEIAKLATAKGNRLLILAHRIELIEQITEAFIDWGVNMDLCDVKMVQSAVHRLDKMPEYNFIITDEIQHGTCKTYTQIYDHYPKAPRLGLTATPKRTNGQGLRDVADILITTESVTWLIENRYLAPFEYYAPKTLVNTETLKTVRGDYEQKGVIIQLNKPKIYGDVIEQYRKYANNKKTIVYASSIEHSKLVVSSFLAVGITAEHIDGKTHKKLRHDIMQRFRSGDTMILCNYEIISEGISVDDCECCILLRPTQSLILFIQSSMRCMRYVEGKTAVILDMVGNFERHGLPDTEHEWSLDGTEKGKKGQQNEAVARTCGNCFRTYFGTNPVCRYCGHDNGKTKEQIKADNNAELERIVEQKRKDKKREDSKAVTLEDLIALGKARGYKNASWWAKNKFNHSWRNK